MTDGDPDFALVERRVRIPAGLWRLVEEVAKLEEATPKWAFNSLMRHLLRISLSKPETLGDVWADARRRLDSQGYVEEHFGVPAIDITQLQRSNKVKSGFTGVYANGKGFRAIGKDPAPNSKIVINLGTYPSAERAAEVRRQYYVKHNMPYGSLADRIEAFENASLWQYTSPETKRRAAIYALAQEGTPAEGLSPEDRIWETQDSDAEAGIEYTAGKAAHQAKLLEEAKARAEAKRNEAKAARRGRVPNMSPEMAEYYAARDKLKAATEVPNPEPIDDSTDDDDQ